MNHYRNFNIFREMNRYGNFNFGSVQSQSSVNHESQASNSIGSINTYFRRESLSHEPNMEYSQMSSGFSRISAAATPAGRSRFRGKSKLQSSASSDDDSKLNEEVSCRNQFVSTDLTLYTWNKSNTQLSCVNEDSENTNIQNFVATLKGCTYSNNIELDNEDSSNQLESLKLTLALPIPKDNTHIHNENTSTRIERDQPKMSTLHEKETFDAIVDGVFEYAQVAPNSDYDDLEFFKDFDVDMAIWDVSFPEYFDFEFW